MDNDNCFDSLCVESIYTLIWVISFDDVKFGVLFLCNLSVGHQPLARRSAMEVYILHYF